MVLYKWLNDSKSLIVLGYDFPVASRPATLEIMAEVVVFHVDGDAVS